MATTRDEKGGTVFEHTSTRSEQAISPLARHRKENTKKPTRNAHERRTRDIVARYVSRNENTVTITNPIHAKTKPPHV